MHGWCCMCRRYGEGARLMPHVDRLRTHAVSVIVNVSDPCCAGYFAS